MIIFGIVFATCEPGDVCIGSVLITIVVCKLVIRFEVSSSDSSKVVLSIEIGGAIEIVGEGELVTIESFVTGTSTLSPSILSIIIIVCVLGPGILVVLGELGRIGEGSGDAGFGSSCFFAYRQSLRCDICCELRILCS